MGHQKQDDAAALTSGGLVAAAPIVEEEIKDNQTMADDQVDFCDEEELDPMEILPEEVWDLIFGLLNCSPEALINCSKVCTSWEGLLSNSKSTWLFAKIFPCIFPYLKNEDILKCRKVCRSWKNGVDGLIENHGCYQPLASDDKVVRDTNRESVYYPLIKKGFYQIRFQKAEDLTKFRLQMEHTSKNPFIGRSLCFFCPSSEEWMMNALHLLQEFGHHVWYFAFESMEPPMEFVRSLTQCLALLPNLKKLRIYSTFFITDADLNFEPQYLEELWEEMGRAPLPDIPSLEILEVFTKWFPPMIKNVIVSTYAGQLHRLEMDDWNEEFANQDEYPLTNLRDFTIKIDSDLHLESLAQFNCPQLKKFEVYLRHKNIDLSLLSRVLYRYKETLRVLKIILCPQASFSTEKFLEPFSNFSIPTLKVLVLVHAEDLPYNFLHGMRSIEHLHFENWNWNQPAESSDHLEIVKVKGYIPYATVKTEKVWIWDVLPSLKKLTYFNMKMHAKKEVTSREMHEFYNGTRT